ncbi:hypothetical protein ACP70R_025154 [Stipagrostis hirtigluma subsp. patula]
MHTVTQAVNGQVINAKLGTLAIHDYNHQAKDIGRMALPDFRTEAVDEDMGA